MCYPGRGSVSLGKDYGQLDLQEAVDLSQGTIRNDCTYKHKHCDMDLYRSSARTAPSTLYLDNNAGE